MTEQRLDDYLQAQEPHVESPADKAVRTGRVGPFRLAGIKRINEETAVVYLDPSNPKWDCTVCGGSGANTYGLGHLARTTKCYYCKGKGFVTNPKLAHLMPDLSQFFDGGEDG